MDRGSGQLRSIQHVLMAMLSMFYSDIFGCTDPTAVNYDSTATIDDGSCIAGVYGCTDPAAINYFPGANLDDGSCCYVAGCTDPTAC